MSVKVRYQWTVPLRKALAISVSKREKLWKKFPCVSHNVELRAKLWAEVADELTAKFGILIDIEDMKKTWKNLKDNYWRVMKTYHPEKAKRWKFFKFMKFMERANIDDSQCSGKNESFPSIIQPIKDDNASTVQPDDEDEDILPVHKIDVHYSKRDRKKQTNTLDISASCKPPQDLVQVCIPEIDSLIQTKQKPRIGAEIYCIAVDNTEDILTTELSKMWENNTNQEDKALSQPVNRVNIATSSKNDDEMFPRKEKSDVLLRNETVRADAQEYKFIGDLIRIAENVNEITYDTRLVIANCASKLRGIYHQAAFSLFLKENMPSGQLHTLLDAFDAFVYYRKPKEPVVVKVIETCDGDIQVAFEALFLIVERNRYSLNLRCPDNRWARLDIESRKNIDYLFGKKRKNCDIENFGAAEYQRIMDKQAVLDQRFEKYSSTIKSTKSLLRMVEPDDKETKKDLENTLRRAKESCNEIRTEQRRLQAEYKEFQYRCYVPLKKRRRKVEEIMQEGNTINGRHYKTTTSHADSVPTTSELFSNYVKTEPS